MGHNAALENLPDSFHVAQYAEATALDHKLLLVSQRELAHAVSQCSQCHRHVLTWSHWAM